MPKIDKELGEKFLSLKKEIIELKKANQELLYRVEANKVNIKHKFQLLNTLGFDILMKAGLNPLEHSVNGDTMKIEKTKKRY